MSSTLGGGKSQGTSTTTTQLNPQQERALKAQTDALVSTFLPAYQSTIGGAGNVYNQVSGAGNKAANTALNVAGQTGALQQNVGSHALTTGTSGLEALFDPNYEKNQVNAALQAGRESARESQAGQNAMYGAAGGLGSSRQALADANLSSLNAQRQATAAAGAQAQVQANKASAAQALMGGGQSNLAAANQAASNRIGIAQSPQDMYSKYASIVFGVPQASTTPNFAGTQGNSTSGKSSGSGFSNTGTFKMGG